MPTSKITLVDPANYSIYYNYCLAKSLADEGLDTEFLTTSFIYENISPPSNVKVNCCFFKVASFLSPWIKSQMMRRALRALEYPFNLMIFFIKLLREKRKVVHYIWVAIPILDLLFFRVLKSMSVKVIYTAHNPFPHELRPWHKWQYRKIYDSVDKIIVLTEYVKKTILQNTNVGPEKITVIPHGDFDYILSQFKPNLELKSELESKVEGCKVVSFFGSIRPYKGLEYLLQAFALVKRQISNVKLCVFGKCYMTNQNFYIDQASKLKLGDSIIFDFRYVPWSDFLAYLDVTHLAVMPYISASQSANIVMLYKKGIPIVVTDVGGLPEMVVNGRSGIIVPTKDPSALAEGIIDALKDEDTRQQMINFANSLAVNEYSWKMIARRTIEEVYEKI